MSFPSVMTKPSWLSLQMLGLKLKLHIVGCAVHPEEKVLEFFEGPSALNIDFEIEQPSKIYESLSSSVYIRYSTIMILINCDCSCRNRILTEILKALQCNKYIKYKLKLIYTSYHVQPEYKNQTKLRQTHFEKHVKFFQNKYNFENMEAKGIKSVNELLNSCASNDNQHITFDDKEPLRDYFNLKLSKLENILLFQLFITPADWLRRAQEMDYILYIIDCLPLISAQELLEFLTNSPLAVQTQGNVELYFYSVNPALAIINNNYMFTNGKPNCGTREGSDKDVLKLIRELKIARIPYILTEDFSRAQLVELVKYLRNKNLKTLKSLIFIMMTHATINNIIYTHDGQLNFIEDILLPLQLNESLKETNISYVNVHCRGDLNAQNSDPDKFDEIQPTQIEQLLPNNNIFYSVPDLVISPRRSKKGTPFVESFCKSFRDLNPQSDVRILFEKTCNDLKNDSYYAYLDCFEKSSELVVGADTKFYCIKPPPTGASEFIPLVESIEQEFNNLNNMKPRNRANFKLWLRNHFENLKKNQHHATTTTLSETANTTFCICANVNEKKISKNLDQLKYFAAELDEDKFVIEEGK